MHAPYRGFSLLEAVFAVYLLVGVALITGQLFSRSARTSSLVRDESTALLLAEQRLRDIRLWSGQSDGTRPNYCNLWSDGLLCPDHIPAACNLNFELDGRPIAVSVGQPLTAGTAVDASLSRFSLQASSWPYVMWRPARDLTNAERMRGCARAVEVTVNWEGSVGYGRGRTLSLVGIAFEPPRRVTSAIFKRDPDSLSVPRNGSVKVTTTLKDDFGAIPSPGMRYYIEPMDGNGTLKPVSGDPASVMLHNYVFYNGGRHATAGRCRLLVRTFSDGREQWFEAGVFQMNGPAGPI